MNELHELLNLIEKSIELDPWVKKNGIDKWRDFVKEEAQEVWDAIENKDDDNFKEELGDLLALSLIGAKLAEQDNKFNLKEVLEGINQKLKERRPYIAENKKVSLEEAEKLWNDAKNAKKQSN